MKKYTLLLVLLILPFSASLSEGVSGGAEVGSGGGEEVEVGSCPNGIWYSAICYPISRSCTCIDNIYNAESCIQLYSSNGNYSPCNIISKCKDNYYNHQNKCYITNKSEVQCESDIPNGNTCTYELNTQNLPNYKLKEINTCNEGYHVSSNKLQCYSNSEDCTNVECSTVDVNAATCSKTWNSSTNNWGSCIIKNCNSGYNLKDNKCEVTSGGGGSETTCNNCPEHSICDNNCNITGCKLNYHKITTGSTTTCEFNYKKL